MAHEVEHTDTFAGEANYCWANRYRIEGDDLSNRALVRRAKALCGLTGIKCVTSHYGDTIEIRPVGLCQVVFVSWIDE